MRLEESSPAPVAQTPRRTWKKAGLIGTVVAVPTVTAALFLGIAITKPPGKRDELANAASPPSKSPVPDAQHAPKAVDPAPASKTAPAKPAPPKPDPKSVTAKAVPPPEPDPASAPVREVRSANVKLPTASSSLSQHDNAPHVLDVALPPAGRYALRLRGLDDADTQNHNLIARPTLSGNGERLTIVRDPLKGSSSAEKNNRREELCISGSLTAASTSSGPSLWPLL